jgi:hypothetical protein
MVCRFVSGTEGYIDVLNDTSRWWIAGGWLAGGAVVVAGGVVAGAPLTLGVLELVLTACLVPPAVMFLIWRGAAAPTVAELLYAVDSNPEPKAGRS